MKVNGCKLRKLLAYLLTLAICFSSSMPAFAEDSLRAAKLADLKGSVSIMKAGGEKTYAAFKGMSLTQGDRIITGKDSSATLEIDEDKEIRIGESTQVNVSELQGSIQEQNDQTGLNLFIGKLWTSIKKKLNIRSKFEIKTPTTVMGVRGTKFYVNSDEGETGIVVLEGRVAATAYRIESRPGEEPGQRVLEIVLNPNEQIKISENVQNQQDVEVKPVDQKQLELFILESIAADPEGVDPALLQGIQQVIEQKREEVKQQELQQQQQQNQGEQGRNQGGQQGADGADAQPQISYADEVVQTSAPANSTTPSSGGSTGSSTPGISLSLKSSYITDNTIVFPKGSGDSIELSIYPADATLTVANDSNPGIADFSISRDGQHTFGVVSHMQSTGEKTVTITASKPGYSPSSLMLNIKIVPKLDMYPSSLLPGYSTPVTVTATNLNPDFPLWDVTDELSLQIFEHPNYNIVSNVTATMSIISNNLINVIVPSGLTESSYEIRIIKSGKVIALGYLPVFASKAPQAGNITVINNSGGDDMIMVKGLNQGDKVKVYDMANATTPLYSSVVTSGNEILFGLLNLQAGGGTIYVSATQAFMPESERVAKTYVAESGNPSPAPDLSNIAVANNPDGTWDYVDVRNLNGGDLVKVYNSLTGGTLLGWGVLPIGQTGGERVMIPQLGIGAGSVYVEVVNPGKAPNATRVQVDYGAEPLPSIANVTVTDVDNSSSMSQGDILRVSFNKNLKQQSRENIKNVLESNITLGYSMMGVAASVYWTDYKTAEIVLGTAPMVVRGGSLIISAANVYDEGDVHPGSDLTVNIPSSFLQLASPLTGLSVRGYSGGIVSGSELASGFDSTKKFFNCPSTTPYYTLKFTATATLGTSVNYIYNGKTYTDGIIPFLGYGVKEIAVVVSESGKVDNVYYIRVNVVS